MYSHSVRFPNSFLNACVSWLFSVRYIPSWIPFLSYEPLAKIGREMSRRIRNEPIEFAKNALVCGHPARTVIFAENVYDSIVARPSIRWRGNICRS